MLGSRLIGPWAHSANDRGDRHAWVDHAAETAAAAAAFAGDFGMAEFGHWLGLWHDTGKLKDRWQQYLADSQAGRVARGGPDHKAAGSLLAMEHLGAYFPLLVHGHHGGLVSSTNVRGWLRDHDTQENRDAVDRARVLLPGQFEPPSQPALPSTRIADSEHRADLLLRMLFSCLVDADWLDTEAHFSPDRSAGRGAPLPLDELWRRFEADHSRFTGSGNGSVDEARHAIYRACLKTAEQPPGLYRLTVPTGGGKTRSAMAFALRHALRHGQRRVIVAVPFISITEQTAQTYRDVFERATDDLPAVLEHHSSADDLAATPVEASDTRRHWAKLAAENWDAPIVVTTTVQLFESLFDRRPSRMRKLHRLANSVLILDEVQALPRQFLAPILNVLGDLTEFYGTTVVLSTATQPAFEVIPEFVRADAREMVPESAHWFDALRRVEYERPEAPLPWKAVAGLMRDERQALAIVNTKRDAIALLDALDAAGRSDVVLHLSTLLCGAHRRDVLTEVRRRLDSREPCLLVSTQVVEAGVDLDFPMVLRATAPLDAIVQAAGRCNRNGLLERGRVIVFEPAEPSPLAPNYRLPTQQGRLALDEGGRPDDPEVLRRYYEGLLQLVHLDAEDIQSKRARFDFPAVAAAFRMIGPTIPVIVRYGDGPQQEHITALIERTRDAARAGHSARGSLQKLQPYIVQFYASQQREFGSHLSEVAPGVFEWLGDYDGDVERPGGRGIVLERLTVDQCIV